MAAPLYDMKAFYRWLSESTDDELLLRKNKIIEGLEKIQNADVKRSGLKLLKLVDEEIFSRHIQ